MARRKIVKIDESRCDGCGRCIVDCPEGALRIVDGKARLVRESFCDGLGACIGVCPQGAITIEDREAAAFDEAAVQAEMQAAGRAPAPHPPAAAGCPGMQMHVLQPAAAGGPPAPPPPGAAASDLSHWPVQLALVPPTAPFLRGADLLLAADCVPVAVPDFHRRFLRGRKVVLGCPKLDDRAAYAAKLRAIIEQAELRSLTVVTMEVPCCAGLNHIARVAIQQSGRNLPATEITVSRTGQVLAEKPCSTPSGPS